MLADFIIANRAEIIAHSKTRLASRLTPRPTEAELVEGIPLFIDQLGAALRLAESSDVIDHEQMQLSAGLHGAALQDIGLTIGQVVHDYGDVCQAVTELAVRKNTPIPGGEFQTLNLCLDDAIAGAVTAYARRAEAATADLGAERLGVLAHELRALLNTALISFEGIRSGNVSSSGSTARVHAHSLMGLRALIDRSLADVRLDTGITGAGLISVADFVEEVSIGAMLQARASGVPFTITTPVDRTLTIKGDRQTLAAALAGLLSNAFRFTRDQGAVTLKAHATADRVLFEVEDQCGSLPPDQLEATSQLFAGGDDRRQSAAIGLSIARRAAQANDGTIRVSNIPGKGCVFTLDLPRRQPPSGALRAAQAVKLAQ